MVNADVVENVLSRKQELEESLKKRQMDLIQKNQIVETCIYDIKEERSEDVLSCQIREEFNRQQKTIQEEIRYIQKQQAIIRRISICFEALPFTWKDILDKLCVQQQKWDSIELSRSTISYRKRKAVEQILEWFHSDLSDIEIIQGGKNLTSGM